MNEFIQTQIWVWALCVVVATISFIIGYLTGKEKE